MQWLSQFDAKGSSFNNFEIFTVKKNGSRI